MTNKKAVRKKSGLFRIHRGFFSLKAQEVFSFHTPWIDWGLCPKWLGSFSQAVFGEIRGKEHGHLPEDLKRLADQMAVLVPHQHFTTTFIQRYSQGEGAKPHLDPKGNVGYTVIAAFGRWEGGETVIGRQRFTLRSGDVLIQRCWSVGGKRLLHSLSKVTKGERYALILNTIK